MFHVLVIARTLCRIHCKPSMEHMLHRAHLMHRRGRKKLLLAKVKVASGRIGIFVALQSTMCGREAVSFALSFSSIHI